MMQSLKRFAANQDGATATEYAVIAGVVSVATVAGAIAIGKGLETIYTTVAVGFG